MTSILSRRLATAACAAALLCLPACLEEDPLARAIYQVSVSLETLASPGSDIPGQELRRDTYTKAVSTLKPLTSGQGSEAQKASAWLLIARAELGLAADAVQTVTGLRTGLLDQVRVLRAELSAFRELSAQAAAVASFDPSGEIAELQSAISERAAGIEAAQAALAQVQEQVAELENRAGAELDQAKALQNEEAQQRESAVRLSPTEALPMFQRAAALRDQVNSRSAQAERLTAQADTLRPGLAEHKAAIDRLTEQRRLLEESIESLTAQLAQSGQTAGELRARAEGIAAEMGTRLQQLEALRIGELTAAFDQAGSALENAAASAQRAAGASRTHARLLAGEINQRRAAMIESHAAALDTLRLLLDDALNGSPALPGAALPGIARAVTEAAALTKTAALEAYATARDDYQAAGASGESADAIDRLVENLNELVGDQVDGDQVDGDQVSGDEAESDQLDADMADPEAPEAQVDPEAPDASEPVTDEPAPGGE